MRQFALERLRETDEEPALRDRHLDHFLALAEQAESELMGPRQASWFARLDADGENLLGALTASRHAARRAGPRRAPGRRRRALLVGARALRRRPAGLTSALEVQAEARAKAGDTAPDPARGKALVRAGGLALYLCDLEAAGPPIDESLAIYRALGDKKGVARAFAARATLAAYRGDLEESRQFGLSSLEIYREIGEPRGIAATLHNLGYLALLQGGLGRGGSALRGGHRPAALGGGRGGDGHDPGGPGPRQPGARARGGSRTELAEAFDLVEEVAAKREGAYALEAAASLAESAGDPARAARYLAAAQALREAIGSPLVPLEQREREARLARIAAALGAPAFAEASEAGRGLGFEAAVAEARAWLAGAPAGA